ncbi:MAG: aminotransferase class IV family protein, partial [Deltaproteobacteria bacterium]|nr:aminotransferase class IV family protein [Deltaproteobacteria bacterium]
MGIVVSIDGERLDPDGRHVSVFDRGFLFGDGVFETFRTYGGRRCFALDEHLERLAWSASRIGMLLPVPHDVLATEIDACIAEANNPESFLRVVVTRGRGPIALDPSVALHPTRVVIVMPLRGIAPELYANGVGIAVAREVRPIVASPYAGAKTCNYVPNLLAVRDAIARGAHEALFVTGDDRVTEGASSNVFVVSGRRLATSPLSEGILAGITRRHVMDVGRALGLEVVE